MPKTIEVDAEERRLLLAIEDDVRDLMHSGELRNPMLSTRLVQLDAIRARRAADVCPHCCKPRRSCDCEDPRVVGYEDRRAAECSAEKAGYECGMQDCSEHGRKDGDVKLGLVFDEMDNLLADQVIRDEGPSLLLLIERIASRVVEDRLARRGHEGRTQTCFHSCPTEPMCPHCVSAECDRRAAEAAKEAREKCIDQLNEAGWDGAALCLEGLNP